MTKIVVIKVIVLKRNTCQNMRDKIMIPYLIINQHLHIIIGIPKIITGKMNPKYHIIKSLIEK